MRRSGGDSLARAIDAEPPHTSVYDLQANISLALQCICNQLFPVSRYIVLAARKSKAVGSLLGSCPRIYVLCLAASVPTEQGMLMFALGHIGGG